MDADEQRQEDMRNGQQAHSLLSNPMLSGFMEKEAKECFEAFVGLPANATLEEYKYIHARIDLARKLERSLEAHITKAELHLLRDERPDEV